MIKGCDTCKYSGESCACDCPNGACLTTDEGYPKWQIKTDLIVELNKKVKLTKQDAELLLLSIYPHAMPSVINDGLLKMIDNGYILPDPVEKMEGLKFDSDKLMYGLLPPECTEELVKVLTYGAKKYAPNNWQLVNDFDNRYYSALMRHLEAWRKGEETDNESNLLHLSHAFCNVMFLLWRELNHECPYS